MKRQRSDEANEANEASNANVYSTLAENNARVERWSRIMAQLQQVQSSNSEGEGAIVPEYAPSTASSLFNFNNPMPSSTSFFVEQGSNYLEIQSETTGEPEQENTTADDTLNSIVSGIGDIKVVG